MRIEHWVFDGGSMAFMCIRDPVFRIGGFVVKWVLLNNNTNGMFPFTSRI